MRCRTLFTFLASGTTFLLSAQSATITPSPNWRLGDKRQVDVQVETKITIDTLTMNMQGSSTYSLEVTGARKDGYELNVRSGSFEMPVTDMGMGAGYAAVMDSVNVLMAAIINAVNEPLSEMEVRYRLDRSGKVLGRIEGKDEKKKLTTAMQQAVTNVIATLSNTTGKGPVSVPEAEISHMVDSLYDAFLQVQVNEMNYFLKIYGTEFPLTGSLRQPIVLEDVQAPLHTGMPKLPGVLEAGLDKNDNVELVGRTITTYDSDSLFAALQGMYPAGTFVRDGLLLEEECVEHFDKRSGWLTQSTAGTRLRSGRLKMDVKERIELKVIQ